MSDGIKRIYDKCPAFFQNLMLTSYCFVLDRQRYGGEYKRYKELLDKTQWFSREQIIDYQNQQLEKIVCHAYDTVPYYKEIFDERGLKPKDIQSQQDLHKLPVLSRQIVKERFNDLRSNKFKKSQLKLGHTSGTTGSPLEIAYDSSVIYMTYALMDRQYQWADARLERFGDRVAVMRGNVIVPIEQKKPPFWRINYLHNQLLLSSFHLSEKNMQCYLQKLQEFQPAVVDGYPSTLYVFGRYLLNIGKTLPVKAVISSSETLYDFQKEVIEKAFDCRVFDYYAAAERVIFSTECDKHEGHHLSDEYGITEVLGKDMEPLSNGNIGLMVGTSLHNYGMPLIRYQTSDISGIQDRNCSCGRSLSLMENVSTKAEDIISLKDGRLISPSVLTHPFKPLHGVSASQIIQEDYDKVIIKLVPNEKYKEKDTYHLINEFRNRLGEEVDIQIELVEELPRTKAGKFKWVISKVDRGIKVP